MSKDMYVLDKDTFLRQASKIKEQLELIFSGVCEKHELAMFQVRILFGIAEGESDTVGGFAECFGANQGNVSTVCKKLAGAGLITRTRSREDERVVLLELTPAGEKKIEEIKATFDSLFEKGMAVAEPEEIEAFMKGFVVFEKFMGIIATGGVR
ncbi:hypothetical protein FACS189499_06610 [Clostridia bacterium]|nr:hypothetical protein FACS189499_06610 [Clostridia bacterium]